MLVDMELAPQRCLATLALNWLVPLLLVACRTTQAARFAPSMSPTPPRPTVQATGPPPTTPQPEARSNGDWISFPSLNDIRSLDSAPDGSLWAATGSGFVLWDLTTDTHIRYSTADGLISDDITDLTVAPDGVLWVTTDQDLAHFDGRDWENARLGLTGAITTMAFALDGSIWLGTTKGAILLQPHQPETVRKPPVAWQD